MHGRAVDDRGTRLKSGSGSGIGSGRGLVVSGCTALSPEARERLAAAVVVV
jgi:hypothetical protein